MTKKEFVAQIENADSSAVIYLPGGGLLGTVIVTPEGHIQLVADTPELIGEVNQPGFTDSEIDSRNWNFNLDNSGNMVLTPETGNMGVIGN